MSGFRERGVKRREVDAGSVDILSVGWTECETEWLREVLSAWKEISCTNNKMLY